MNWPTQICLRTLNANNLRGFDCQSFVAPKIEWN